jgi:phosphoribosyl-AMP cyclohydrolase
MSKERNNMTNNEQDACRIEEGVELRLDFSKLAKAVAGRADILPVAVQNVDTKEVILIGYTNREALEKAIETRGLVLWSTSRNQLWVKGATSGAFFELVEIRVNCEQNSLVYLARPRKEGICHTRDESGRPRNCYYRRLNLQTRKLEFVRNG